MTSISGSFTPCEASSGQGNLFALQYTCDGPGCSEANGLMGTTCTGSGSSWSCSNGVMNTAKTGLTSEFQYLVKDKKLTSYSNHCTFSNCDFIISATSNDTFAIPSGTDHCPELPGSSGTTASKEESTTQKTTSKQGSVTQKITSKQGSTTQKTLSTASVSKSTTVITTTLGSGVTITTTSISTSSPSLTAQPSGSLGFASSRVHPHTFVILFTFWILFFLLTQVTGVSATSFDIISGSTQTRGPARIPELSPAIQTTALVLQRSVNTEKEALETIKDLFKNYFVDKALALPGDESGSIDSFVDKILKTACELLLSVPGEAISTAFKKTFIQDCILDAFEILWPAVVAGPEFMIPAILVGSTTICYWMLGKFISTVLQADEIKELVCTPPEQPVSVTEPATQPPGITSTAVKPKSTTSEPVSTTTIPLVSSVTPKSGSTPPATSPEVSRTTSTTTRLTSTTTKPVSTPIQPPVSSSIPKSGWTLAFPDSIYFSNDIDVDLNNAGLYLTVNSVKTVNTKCVSGVNFQVAGGPITVKKGSNYVFETKKEPNPDTCCLVYYSNANCAETAGQFQKRCETVQELSPIDVLSWKVYGCTGVWTGVAA